MIDDSNNEHTFPIGAHTGKRSGFTPAENQEHNRRMTDSVPAGIEQTGTTMRGAEIQVAAIAVAGLSTLGAAALTPTGKHLLEDALTLLGPVGKSTLQLIQDIGTYVGENKVEVVVAATLLGAATLFGKDVSNYLGKDR